MMYGKIYKARIIGKEVKGTHEEIYGVNNTEPDHLLDATGLFQAQP